MRTFSGFTNFSTVKAFILLIAAVVGMASCEKLPDAAPATPHGPSDLGGLVIFTDEFQNDTVAPAANLVVSATNTSTNEVATATVDGATGRYTFPGLAPGTYNINYKADNYPAFNYLGYYHAGGDTATTQRNLYMYPASTTTLDSLRIDTITNIEIKRYSTQLTLIRGRSFTVQTLDTIRYIRDSARTVLYTPVIYPAGTVLTFNKDTTFQYHNQVSVVTKVARVRGWLTQPSLPNQHQSRGMIIYFSDDAGVQGNAYKMLQDTILYTPNGQGARSMYLDIPLTDFQSAGILRLGGASPNTLLYARAYGLSGTKNWFGATKDIVNNVKYYVGVNPNGSAGAAKVLPSTL